MMPAAQMRRSPRSSGEGRLRASLAVSLSHSRAYSASRCRAQNARLIAVIPLKTRRIAGRELRDLARIGKARHGWHPPWISALGLAPNLPRLLGSGGAQPRDRPLSPSTIAERCQRVSGPWDQKGGTSNWPPRWPELGASSPGREGILGGYSQAVVLSRPQRASVGPGHRPVRSVIARVKAYWVSVSMFIFTAP